MTDHLEKLGIFLSEEEHISRIKKYFDSSFIITNEGEQVGLLKYLDTYKSIELIQLQVLPKHQRKGIGKYVLDYLIEMSDFSHKDLLLQVLKQNPARYLYERNSFVIVDEDEFEFHMIFKRKK